MTEKAKGEMEGVRRQAFLSPSSFTSGRKEKPFFSFRGGERERRGETIDAGRHDYRSDTVSTRTRRVFTVGSTLWVIIPMSPMVRRGSSLLASGDADHLCAWPCRFDST